MGQSEEYRSKNVETQCVNDSVINGTVDVDTALRFSVDIYSGTCEQTVHNHGADTM